MTAPSHTRVTKEQWIEAALRALHDVAIDQLKVLRLAADLGVSRSSFYWYFTDVDELRDQLLERWQGNTTSIVDRSSRPAPGIVVACLGVFECWADRTLYVPELDLAVRDWARRADAIAARVAGADLTRLEALAEMFQRHGHEPTDALVRARLLYHSQVGYFALGTAEDMATRLAYLPHYLLAMTGTAATDEELDAFTATMRQLDD